MVFGMLCLVLPVRAKKRGHKASVQNEVWWQQKLDEKRLFINKMRLWKKNEMPELQGGVSGEKFY